jgi:dihydropteroate synthase
MGVLNVTPDSFSDGGVWMTPDAALARARQMVAEGADIIDVGGESTRPGARAVPEQEEIDRVLPVVEAIARELDTCISVDTSSPALMRAASGAGAHLLNDVRALRRDGALQAAAEGNLAVCLMHMRGEPETMQQGVFYEDVVEDVIGFLRERIDTCVQAGIARERLLLDPGFGFGKTFEHNLRLLRRLPEVAALGLPVLAGLSRKSTIGSVLAGPGGAPRPLAGRLHGSVAAALMAVLKGASVVRVHDVAATADALAVFAAVQLQEQKG